MAGYEGGDDFDGLIVKAAYDLMGLPNKVLSKANDMRFGTKGAISIIPDRGVFFDHHDNHGGGVLQFVQEAGFMTKAEAVDYLRTLGLKENDDFDNGRFTDGRGKVVYGPPREYVGADVLERPAEPKAETEAPPVKSKIVATYDYVSEDGELIQQVLKLEPKSYRQRRPDGDGWSYKVAGHVPIIPYRLPELIEATAYGRPIWIVEGEKDVDALAKLGITATCNAGGSGKWGEAHAAFLVGADVIICPDNDEAGRKHCETVGRSLEGVASKVRVLHLPDLPEKGDVSDFLQICEERGNAHPDDVLWRLAENRARPFGEHTSASKYGAVHFRDIDDIPLSSGYVVKGVVPQNGLVILYGDSQAGKSFLAMDIALHVAMGRDWFGNRVKPGGVIYQAGEGEAGIFPRFIGARDALKAPKDLPIKIIPKAVDLWSATGDVEPLIEEIKRIALELSEPLKLIIIDTHAAASAGADENSAKEMTMLIQHYKAIQAATGATVIVVHHRNSSGEKMRGHTSLPAAADATIEVTFDAASKTREFCTVKQKDGPNGKRGQFELRQTIIGQDEDGDPRTTCYIAPIKGEARAQVGGTTSQKAAPKLPAAAALALRALQDELSSQEDLDPAEFGATNRSNRRVTIQKWQDRFYRQGFDANTSKGTMRVAFMRALHTLLDRNLIEREEEYVWTTLAGDRMRRRAFAI